VTNTSLSPSDWARLRIKKAWQTLPTSLRELPLKVLCFLRMGRRQHVQATANSPTYIIGNFQAGGGLSRSVELYAEQARQAKGHCLCVDVSKEMLQSVKKPASDGSLRSLAEMKGDAGAGSVVIHLNPPQFLWLLCKLGRKFFRHKHIVAYWAWELENIPPLWKFALRFVDAVEAPSTFIRDAIARNTEKPVAVHPHVVRQPNAVKQSYCHNGTLRCLFVFDMVSFARKNPQAAIAAFLRAFKPGEAELTIKMIQAEVNVAALKELQARIAPHPHIRLVAEWMDDAALECLFLAHDVYLSLHRSEGYGLTILEAMLRKLYVVATGWSGNMDFMKGERVFTVPYTLVPVNEADRFFGSIPSARWAESDVVKAAEILQDIRRNLASLADDKPACHPYAPADGET
jgi:hypothetical protein